MEMNEWKNVIKLSALKVAKFLFRQGNCEVINRNGFQPVRVFNLSDGSYHPTSNFAMHLLIISATIESVFLRKQNSSVNNDSIERKHF